MEDDFDGDRRRTQTINDIRIHSKQVDFERDDVKIDEISVWDHISQTHEFGPECFGQFAIVEVSSNSPIHRLYLLENPTWLAD